ncbi:MAG: hypothetical protein ABSA80_19870 [Terriglobales bacterium]|jgi:hypothetical protein
MISAVFEPRKEIPGYGFINFSKRYCEMGLLVAAPLVSMSPSGSFLLAGLNSPTGVQQEKKQAKINCSC